MARFVEFEADDGSEILINIDEIRTIRAWQGDTTCISFARDDSTIVKGALKDIKMRLTFGQK